MLTPTLPSSSLRVASRLSDCDDGTYEPTEIAEFMADVALLGLLADAGRSPGSPRRCSPLILLVSARIRLPRAVFPRPVRSRQRIRVRITTETATPLQF